jgi:TolB-like protein
MASLIPRYEYDIFISYRQKDNKGNRWVSVFVEALKTELESTFKEDISIYYDENPHDGVLETHSVDKSLEGKLNCLIFIPIISQTYCDPKSFAWQHEFCAFNKLAKEDQFGRDIKLKNGNVASRILPIKIHDLDPEDKELLEKELGGILRCIEFIYKSAGVNRPLLAYEDHPQDNLNKTYYRDQINKVANAVKEIITVIKKPIQQEGKVSKEVVRAKPEHPKKLNPKIISTSVIVLAMIVLGYFFIPKLLKFSRPIEKSIAVLPFINDSPSDSITYFMNGVMEEILANLQTVKNLRVISRTSVEQYRKQTKSIPEIAKELGVNYIAEGSGQKYSNKFRFRVQLIRASKDSHLWAKSYEKEIKDVKDIFSIQSEIAQAIAEELEAAITSQEKQLIEKIPTVNLEAYDAYLKGQFYLYKATSTDLDTAMQCFELAKDKDPQFARAYAGIGLVWIFRQQLGWAHPDEAGTKGMASIMRALELDSTIAEVHYTLAGMNVYGLWDWKAGESAFKKAIAIKPNYAEAHGLYSHLLNIMGRPEEAMEHIELALKLDPQNPTIKVWYSQDLLYAHRYDDVISVSREVFEKNPNMFMALDALFQALHLAGRYEEAFDVIKLYTCNMYKDFNHVFDQYAKLGYASTLNLEGDTLLAQSKSKYIIPLDIAYFFLFAGNKERALGCMEQSYEIHDPNIPYIGRPTYAILYNEPRFQNLARKINVPYK